MILALLLALATPTTEAVAPVVVESRCGYVHVAQGAQAFVELPALRVIEQTAQGGRFPAELPDGAAILCWRSSIVPAANDWKAIAGGHLLFIAVPGESRVGALERAGDGYRYSLLNDGGFSREERANVDRRMQSFAAAARAGRR